MPIRIEQPGAAKAAAQAGIAIGRGKRAEEERARAEREQARAQQIAAQQAARKAAIEWEQQKMLLNSQQDFAHEMRIRQAGLDAEARSREWQVEKMELASRIDFEQDEKERIRRKAEYTAGRDSINDNENLTDGQKNMANFLLSTKYTDISEAAAGLGLRPQTSGLFDFRSDPSPVPPPSGTPGPTVDNPLGLNIESIPISQLPRAVLGLESANKFEVISPDGETETIDADQWPDYKARGYLLASIVRQQGQRTLGEISQIPGIGGF
jgi:multidrug efflux pump subunit AcrA (membrane-fusion protein)